MKKKLLFMQCLVLGIVLVCSVGAKAQTTTTPQVTLSGDPDAITPVIFTAGSSENVAYLYATDVATFCGTEFNLFLPEGVSIIKKANSTLTKDEEGENIHTVQFSNKGAEGWKLLIYSSELTKFNGNNGALAKLTFSVSDTFTGGKASFKDCLATGDVHLASFEDSSLKINEINQPIQFIDSNVENLSCMALWDMNNDGKLSYKEAANVHEIELEFKGNEDIKYFSEFQYFTGLTTIPSATFYNCTSLQLIKLPATITTIGNSAFSGCSSMKDVYVSWTTPISIDASVFNAVPIGAVTLHVPYGKKALYQAKDVWKDFGIINDDFDDIIDFADANVKAICVANWDTNSDGELSYDEAAAVTDLGKVFYDNHDITSFNELQYFTGLTEIGPGAFQNCNRLASITIPNSVTSIGNAFAHCSGLTSVTIPNSVTSIGEHAFTYCIGLTSIVVESGNIVYDSRDNCNAIIETATNTLLYGCMNTKIPNTVTSIGYAAFLGCSGLTSVTIPNSVTSIGHVVFSDCSGLTSIVVESGNIVYDSRDNCNAIIETATNTLLYGCMNTKIHNTVTSIGYAAFSGCSGLTSVTIPNSVTSIGEGAFSVCSGLTSVTIPNSVTSIGEYAFEYCIGLTSVTIPNSVTSIGEGAFSNCRGLTSIVVESGNIVYDSRDNCNAIIETATNTLLYGCMNTKIHNTVTSIGYHAFYVCSGLTSVTIPNSVTSIGEGAFEFCIGLTSVVIPNSVISIGHEAFRNCSSLKDVYVEWNTPLAPLDAETDIFNKTPINSATLHVPIGTKEKYATAEVWKDFGTIVDDVTSGNIEFADADVKALCVANWDTNSDGELSYDEAKAVTSLGEVFRANNNITSFNELQNFTGLSEIGDNAFSYCSSLTGITIPNSVTKIGDFAFSECSGLTNLTIPNSVTSIGSNTFYLCQGLMNMTIPNSVTEIGSYAFAGCSGLNSVTISNCVTAIGEHTFDDCSNLTNVTIPNSVTLIGEQAFSHCSSLTNMTVPNSVTEIGGYAFDYCSSLASVTIPNSVTWIGNEAFRGCNSLKHVYVNWDTPLDAFNKMFQASIFGKVYYIQDATLHVPVYTKRKYAAETVWEDFGRIISFNDVNRDGVLTVADVTGVKNFILDLNTSGLWAEAADVNEDSKYLVDDLKDEVDLVLMGLTLAKDENNAKGEMNWTNIVFAKSDDGELIVCTNDVGRYVGIQFDLMLPDDIELINTRTGKGAAGYAVRSQKLDNGMTRVIAYAMNTNTINDTEVLRLKFRSTDGSKDKVCDVTLHEISLSTPNALAVGSRDIDATVTLNEATGINSIYGDSNADAIYNMQGQKLVKAQRGINLTNGKKFIKR